MTESFGDVLVPTESVQEMVKGQRRTMTRKFFPGYMFVQMVLNDATFHLVKNTRRSPASSAAPSRRRSRRARSRACRRT